jgi:hypothetical protein
VLGLLVLGLLILVGLDGLTRLVRCHTAARWVVIMTLVSF